MSNKFPCSGCGCCCKRIDKILKDAELLDDYHKEHLHFPYSHTNGVCEKLTEDNKCSVYDERPLICNFEKSRQFFKISIEDFNEIVVPSCNQMMDEDGADISLRIPCH